MEAAMKSANWQENRTMKGEEFVLILEELGLSQAGAGRYLGFSERHARRVVLNEAPLKPSEVLLLRAAVRFNFRPKAPQWISPRKAGIVPRK
jgi:hypothetical protein